MFRITIALAGLCLLASCATEPAVSPAARSELAPTGKLRVGINYGNPLFAKRGAAPGQEAGVALDLARELGRRIGAPVEILGYDSGGQLTAALKQEGWDVVFLAYEPEREAEVAFAGAFAEVDSTYLVPAGSPLRNASDGDPDGVRIRLE